MIYRYIFTLFQTYSKEHNLTPKLSTSILTSLAFSYIDDKINTLIFNAMEIVTVELKNTSALEILKSLESANLLHIVDAHEEKKSDIDSIKSLKGSLSVEKSTLLLEDVAQSRRSWDLRTT